LTNYQGALDAAKQINAHRTYMVGFSHRITHDGWSLDCVDSSLLIASTIQIGVLSENT
jgi:hypothetical protein